jgi:protein-S-isoprenylcysteine O-methyltransferase Ste14
MTRFTSFVQWAGGVVFVSALAVCGYTYLVVWSRTPPFDRAAIPADAALFAVFAAHHSVFAREAVKRRLTTLIPQEMLRSVYVWVAGLLLVVVCRVWRPVGGELYDAHGWRAVVHGGVQLAGLLVIFGAVRTINPLELAGIGRHAIEQSLQIVGPYRWVRHPLYFGWLLATFGAAHLTGDRLIFAAISAFYLAVAVAFEERSLIVSFGDDYRRYQRQVRWRMLPFVY